MKRKLRLYKKGGRCEKWWETDRQLQERIDESRGAFVERMLEEGPSSRSFYAATRKLASAANVPQWGVRDLYPGMDPAQVCREILQYFGNISSAAAVPIPEIQPCHGGLKVFDVARTTALLERAKKTDSYVPGDPLPHLVRCHPAAFAVPVAAIYNKINITGKWPTSWKTEHLTIIPKTPNPSDLSECRNISCTSVFSKILEGEVLVQLRSELVPDMDQYGGVPKCGVEHLLIDLWESVLAGMEGGTNAAVLLGVDYEKAFNRMEHAACLEQLHGLGASPGSISLVRAFLQDRRMSISIDGAKVPPVPIHRGSPQGSVLGCLLYCATTQKLTKDMWQPRGEEGVQYFPGDGPDGQEVAFWNREPERDDHLEAFLYVDDTTLFDRVPMESAVRHITAGTTTEKFDDLQIGRDFEIISERAEEIGMKINGKKTQLLVISPPNGCDTSAEFVTSGGVEVKSVDTLKLVGFTFGSRPDAGAHVRSICEQYQRKKWMLYHLRDSGFKGTQLFCCYVRSGMEYCSVVYHSLLNGGQEELLERLQRHAVRICYGYSSPVEEIISAHSIQSLRFRRLRRCDKFIGKAVASDRFGERWFPARDQVGWQLRTRRHVQELTARSLRRFNSPLAFLRRRANDIGVLPMEGAREQ